MRTFTDNQGNEWDAAAAFGSQGAVQLVFSRRHGSELRSCGMQAETLREAERELAECSDVALRERLSLSDHWQ